VETLKLESRPARANQQITVVIMEGELVVSSAASFESYLGEIIKQKEPKIVLNMEKVFDISGRGFGSLLTVLRETRNRDGDLKIVNVSAEIFEIFRILNFQDLFQMLKNEEVAVKAFDPSDRNFYNPPFKGVNVKSEGNLKR